MFVMVWRRRRRKRRTKSRPLASSVIRGGNSKFAVDREGERPSSADVPSRIKTRVRVTRKFLAHGIRGTRSFARIPFNGLAYRNSKHDGDVFSPKRQQLHTLQHTPLRRISKFHHGDVLSNSEIARYSAVSRIGRNRTVRQQAQRVPMKRNF